MLKTLLGINWRTTMHGIVTAVGLICANLGYALDTDPSTIADWEKVATAIGAILASAGIVGLGLTARDKNVSSAQMQKDGK